MPAAFAQESQVELLVQPAENLPGHVDAAVGNDPCRGGDGWLSKRRAEGPTTEHVPVLDAGDALELDQLVARLLRNTDVFQRHRLLLPKVARLDGSGTGAIVELKPVTSTDPGSEPFVVLSVNLLV